MINSIFKNRRVHPLQYGKQLSRLSSGVRDQLVFLFCATSAGNFSADVSGARIAAKGSAVSLSNLGPSVKYYPPSWSSHSSSSNSNGTVDCLPADAMVAMDGGLQRYKRADELDEGDNTHIGGKVFMFTHRDAHRTAQFVRMETSEYDGESGVGVLEVTPGHFVYANGHLIPARDVRIGDWLQKSSDDGSNPSKNRVVNIRHVMKQGVYNPETMTGDIGVNEFVVSTYTEAIHPNAAHPLLTPLRMIYHVLNLYI